MKIKIEETVLSIFGMVIFANLLATIAFLIRLPFCNDSYFEFLRMATYYSLVIVAVSAVLTLIFAVGSWLFAKSFLFRVSFLLIFGFSVILTMFKNSPCIETRYLTCLN
jgi:hypothetical protein